MSQNGQHNRNSQCMPKNQDKTLHVDEIYSSRGPMATPLDIMSDEFSPPSRLGIGMRPFDVKGGKGMAVNLVSWSDNSRQGVHPVSKLDAK